MKRLYDFSGFTAFTAVFSFGLLLSFFAYSFIHGSGIHYGILFLLLLAALIWLLIRFVFRAARLEEDGAHCRKLFIEKSRLNVEMRYDSRFRESIYLLRDTQTDYRAMTEKEAAAAQIRVEATSGNRKKLEAYTGLTLPPAEKPRVKRKSRYLR